MTMKDYLVQSSRTMADTFFQGLVPWSVLVAIVDNRLETAPAIDDAKKALFYGKRSPAFHDLVTECMKDDGVVTDYDPMVDQDLIHAILGVDSESAELMELLSDYLATGQINREKLIDEAGDKLWYLALLFRKIGVTFEEVADRNIAKLSVRYPDKFTTDLALHRDETAEKVVFQ